MDRTLPPNTLRYRISHSYTQKAGWKWETTVELVGVATDLVDLHELLEAEVREVDNIARAEARTRDRLDMQDAA